MAKDDPNPDEELDLDVDPPEDEEAALEDESTDAGEQDPPSDDPIDAPLAAKDDEPAPVAERQPSRSESRIRTLTEQIRDRDVRLAEANRRIDDLLARQARPIQAVETPEQRQARFSLMTPQEQIAETLRESEQRTNARLQQMQMQTLEATDKASFQAKYSSRPEFLAKWGPKVEGLVAEQVAKTGMPIEREIALKHLVGGAYLDKLLSKEAKMEVQQAKRRVQAQRTRPNNTSSDTQAQRRSGSTAERRLENVQI